MMFNRTLATEAELLMRTREDVTVEENVLLLLLCADIQLSDEVEKFLRNIKCLLLKPSVRFNDYGSRLVRHLWQNPNNLLSWAIIF